jgi:hypothetical protein
LISISARPGWGVAPPSNTSRYSRSARLAIRAPRSESRYTTDGDLNGFRVDQPVQEVGRVQEACSPPGLVSLAPVRAHDYTEPFISSS